MTGYQPLSTYPFAMSSALFIGSLIYTFFGSKASFSITVVATFIPQAIILLLIPFAVNFGGATAYYSCFVLLFLYGLFAGVC